MQKNEKSNLFKYGARTTLEQRKSSGSGSDILPDALNKLQHDYDQLKTRFDEEKKQSNKMAINISKLKSEMQEQRDIIKLLESDLKKYKTLSFDLADALKNQSLYLTKTKQNLKQQLSQNTNQQFLQENEKHNIFENFIIVSADKEQTIQEYLNNEETNKIMQNQIIIIIQQVLSQKSFIKVYKLTNFQLIIRFCLNLFFHMEQKLNSRESQTLQAKSMSKFSYKQILQNNLPWLINRQIFECFRSHIQIGLRTILLLKYFSQISQSKQSIKDFFLMPVQKKNKYITLKKTYVFMTQYPFISFFVNIIHNLIDEIKLRKSQLHTTFQSQDEIEKIDYSFHLSIKDEIEQMLKQFLQLKFSQQMKFKGFNQNIDLQINSQDQVLYMDCEWGTFSILNILTLEQFIEILSSLLIEKNVVIVSKQRNLLSAAMLLFHSLLKPFQWPHPFISTLSEEMMPILDSPVPVFVGLLKHEDQNLNELTEKYEDILFVEIEGYLLKSQLQITLFNEKKIEQSQSLKKLNSYLKPNFTRLKLKDVIINQIENQDIILTADEFEVQTYYQIFESVSEFYENQIIKHINKNDIQLEDTIEKIIKLHEGDNFIQSFVQTQIFAFHLENYQNL